MNRVQMLRLFVCLPKISRLTACQFCVSNNVRHKSVFMKNVDFETKNKVPVNHDGVTDEGQQEKSQLNSLNSVGETEQSDKIDSVGQLNSGRKNSKILLTNETVTKLTKPNKNKNEYSKILKSVAQIQTSDNPLKYILNCKLIPDDVNSALQDEDFLLFHEHLEKHQITPSVSRVLFELNANNENLISWRNKQIKYLGEEGFHNSLIEKRRNSSYFRNTIHKYLSGEKNVEIAEDIQGHWKSIKHVLDSFEEDDIKMKEVTVEHPLLHYTGRFDCIAVYRKTLCVIQWKSSKTPKPFLSTTRDFPLQAVAYLGAVNATFPRQFQKFGPVTNVLIVISYAFGQPAHVHYLNDKMVEMYWKQWLQTLYSYWTKQQFKPELTNVASS